MNKKGEFGEVLEDNAIYLVLFVLFLAATMAVVIVPRNSSGFWAQRYASEIGLEVDRLAPGTVVKGIDVQKAAEIASKNGIPLDEMFYFDNAANTLFVKLSPGGATVFKYYNNVDVLDWKVTPAVAGGTTTTLSFRVVEAQK